MVQTHYRSRRKWAHNADGCQRGDTYRTLAVQCRLIRTVAAAQRIEVRATPEDRALIDRAVAAAGTNVTAFVLSSVTTAARQVLADRTEFVLSPEAVDAWEAINQRPARDLPGLRELMQRPSPFIRE